MRLHELARALGRSSRDLLVELRADGEWISSHRSTVPEPVVRRYLPEGVRPRVSVAPALPVHPRPMSMVPDVARPRPVWRPRRRRGPAQVTLRETPPPNEDYYYSPAELLRYQRVLTTRDVADLYDVTLATVRQWVARGHIAPTGKLGPSNVFDAHQVREAVEAILERSWVGRLKGEPAVGPIPPRYWDAIVTPTEAARLIGVSPSSIRSWLNRGHITRLQSSTSRAVELRLGDVVAAAARKRGRTPRKQPLI